MKSSIATAAALVFALTLASAPPLPITYHVSPAGSDTHSGESSQTAFATPDRAVQAVRELRHTQSGSLHQPVTIYQDQGTYLLTIPAKGAAQ
jgi:hypothetical protein